LVTVVKIAHIASSSCVEQEARPCVFAQPFVLLPEG